MAGHPVSMAPSIPVSDRMPAEQPERPRWSAAEAARRCGVGRASIQRALTDGRIPGAEKTDKGWSIPLDGLLAAGFTPDRPSPPDRVLAKPDRAAREHDRALEAEPTGHAHRIAELEAALTVERARADLEHAHRLAAEALATERAERVADLRLVLRQLGAAPEPAFKAPASEPEIPQPPSLRSRLLNRIGRTR